MFIVTIKIIILFLSLKWFKRIFIYALWSALQYCNKIVHTRGRIQTHLRLCARNTLTYTLSLCCIRAGSSTSSTSSPSPWWPVDVNNDDNVAKISEWPPPCLLWVTSLALHSRAPPVSLQEEWRPWRGCLPGCRRPWTRRMHHSFRWRPAGNLHRKEDHFVSTSKQVSLFTFFQKVKVLPITKIIQSINVPFVLSFVM